MGWGLTGYFVFCFPYIFILAVAIGSGSKVWSSCKSSRGAAAALALSLVHKQDACQSRPGTGVSEISIYKHWENRMRMPTRVLVPGAITSIDP